MASQEEKDQEDLSWLNFCPVCGGPLEAHPAPKKYLVSTKDCPKRHGCFSVDYQITFSLNKDSE